MVTYIFNRRYSRIFGPFVKWCNMPRNTVLGSVEVVGHDVEEVEVPV